MADPGQSLPALDSQPDLPDKLHAYSSDSAFYKNGYANCTAI